MPYYYTDPSRETDPNALPNVVVFDGRPLPGCDPAPWFGGLGFYYAFGFPGCLWDSDPVGPFDTEAAALADARREASCE